MNTNLTLSCVNFTGRKPQSYAFLRHCRRRLKLVAGVVFSLIASLSHSAPAEKHPDGGFTNERYRRVLNESQPLPDLGNGYFQNPIMSGHRGDPSVVRVGDNYYMTHSGAYAPHLVFWHSKDLVNWKPVTRLDTAPHGRPWAPDLVVVDDRFYVYVTLLHVDADGQRHFNNYVYHADAIDGPWQGPFDLQVQGLIDPGHLLAGDGSRYLFFSKGMMIKLSRDGKKRVTEPKKVYDGWRYPEHWVVECFCLESPKFFYRNGYYYWVSAQGGTRGPSTSHMAVVARSKSPQGPWQNSPFNPLLRTRHRGERWWSQGHATLLDDTAGGWWAVFHAYENGYATLGRQTLMLPVAWQGDWPVIDGDVSPEHMLPKPAGESVFHGMPLSDDFSADSLSLHWKTFFGNHRGRVAINRGRLHLYPQKQRPSSADVTRNSFGVNLSPVNHAYEIRVQVTRHDKAARAGLLVSAGGRNGSGVLLAKGQLEFYWRGNRLNPPDYEQVAWPHDSIHFKIQNRFHDLVIFYSADGEQWQKYGRSFEVQEGYGVIEPTLIAVDGEASFDNFRYLGLSN